MGMRLYDYDGMEFYGSYGRTVHPGGVIGY